MAWETPKTDWTANPKIPDPSDFNRIEGNIDFLKQDIETKKGLIVDAINDMNQTADVTDTYAQLAGKIRDISKDADASVDNVLSGKTFYQGGGKKTGTMPNRAGDTEALAISRSGTTLKLRAPKGFYDGIDDNVTYNDPNWIAANIPVGISIFGLTGSNTNKKWASGTINYTTGTLSVSNLSFKPNFVILTCNDTEFTTSGAFWVGVFSGQQFFSYTDSGKYNNIFVAYTTGTSSVSFSREYVSLNSNGFSVEANSLTRLAFYANKSFSFYAFE
jgi:hypothetical protein